MAHFTGVSLAQLVGLLGTFARFDRDRAYYPTVTIVTPSYYALFAVMGASPQVLVKESVVVAVFIALAILGFKYNLWLIVAALLAHGIFDLVQRVPQGDFSW